MKQKKYLLPESEIPTAWFNIQAIMPNKPLPFLHPGTRQPLKPEDLYPIFVEECANQELNQKDEWIEIPDEIRQQYASYRCTPLVRAYELEEALAQGDITQELFDLAINTGKKLKNGLLSEIDVFKEYTMKCFNMIASAENN